jgi:hypothetical protein
VDQGGDLHREPVLVQVEQAGGDDVLVFGIRSTTKELWPAAADKTDA